MVPRMNETSRNRSFGYEEVPPEEHARRVRGVFESVASRYDLMNDLMSGGIHRLWKRSFIRRMQARPHETLLDVGGGTGDIATGWLRAGGGHAIVCDANPEMVSVGRDRALDRGILGEPIWIVGQAEHLPIPDSSVETYSIAFCMRNVTGIEAALREARRVLKPAGRFLCLEFSRLAIPALRPIYDAYSFGMLPFMGRLVANDAESYRYLAESIRRFPPQQEFAAMIADAGLAQVKWTNLTGGVAAIHSARRV